MVKNYYKIIKNLFFAVLLLFFGGGYALAQVTVGFQNYNATAKTNQTNIVLPVVMNTGGATVTNFGLEIVSNTTYFVIDNLDFTGTFYTQPAPGDITFSSNKLDAATMRIGSLRAVTGTQTLFNVIGHTTGVPTAGVPTQITINPANSSYNANIAFSSITNASLSISSLVVNFHTYTDGENKHVNDEILIPVELSSNIDGNNYVAYNFAFTYDPLALQFLDHNQTLSGSNASLVGTASASGLLTENISGGTGIVGFTMGFPGITSNVQTLVYLRAKILKKVPSPTGTPLTFTSFTLTKNGGATSTASTLNGKVVTVNQTPYFNNPPASVNGAEANQLSITLDPRDLDLGDSPVVTYVAAESTVPVSGLNNLLANAPKLTGNVFTWTPGYNQFRATPYTAVFSVTDNDPATTPVKITVLVNIANTNQVPTGLNFNPDLNPYTIPQGTQLQITLNGVDADVPVNGDDALSYSFTQLSGPTTIPPTAISGNVFTWTPEFGLVSPGTYTVSFTVKDLALAPYSVTKSITVTAVNNPPSWTATGAQYMPPVTVREGVSYPFTYIAKDPEGAAVTYQVNINQNGSPVLIPWISIVPSTGVLTINPPINTSGTYNITVAASDGYNQSVLSPIAVLTVVPDNQPTISFNPIATIITAIEGTPINPIAITTADVDAGDAVTLLTSGVPATASCPVSGSPLQSAILTWTPPTGSAGTYTITFTAKDMSVLPSVPAVTKTLTINVYARKIITIGTIVKADGSTGYKNDEVLIPVNTSSITAQDMVTSYNMTATFNPDVINIIGYKSIGTLSGNPGAQIDVNPNNTTGTVNVGYLSGAAINNTNPGTLIYLRAKLVGKGVGTFTVNTLTFNGGGIPPTDVPKSGTVVVGNQAPVFITIADIAKKEAELVTFTAVATDGDGDNITYSTDFSPSGSSLTPADVPTMTTAGVFTWKPGYYQKGNYTISVYATDGTETVVTTVKVTVTDNNRAPYAITLSPDVPTVGYYTVNLLATLPILVTGSDYDTDNTLTYSIADPQLLNAQINPTTGAFTFAPGLSQTGTYDITFVVKDASMAQFTKTVTIKVDTKAPSFTVIGAQQLPVFGTTIREGQVKTYQYTAIDPQGLPLNYELSQPSPAFASINHSTGLVTLSPSVGHASNALYPLVVIASNSVLPQLSNIAYIKVDANTVPTWSIVGAQVVGNTVTVAEETQINFTVNSVDPDADEVVTLTATPADPNTTMPGATLVKSATALQSATFAWKPVLGKAGNYSITFDSKDLSNANSAPLVINIVVTKNNYAPVFGAKLDNRSIAAGSTVTFQYTATDNNNDPLTWAVVSPAGAQITQNGAFTYVANTPGSIPVDVTVTDGFSAPVHATATLTVSGFTINGKITYGATTGKALANVTVVLTKPDNSTVTRTTDATGTYSYDNLAPATYPISFTKTDEWGGINAADALAIARNVVYRDDPNYPADQFDAFMKKVADVTGDGQVTSDDALAVLYRFVGRTPNGWAPGDWVFSSASTLSLTNANITNNVLGLAKGDVNKSLFATVAKSNATFGGSVVKINAKASFDIPVTANMINDLGSISMKMSYPVELAKFNGITFNSKLAGVVYKNNASEGTISVAWIGDVKTALNLGNKEVLFTLKFTATDKFQRGNSFALTLDPLSEITSNNGTMLEKSSLNAPKVEVSVPDAFSLKQNYPNPFNPSTTIAYDIPVSGRVKLVVMNILGQQVATVLDAVQDAGSYKVNFDASRLSSGVYIYTMTVDGASQKYTKTNRMVLMK